MKQTIGQHEFTEAFVAYGQKDSFSYDALRALFDYFEQCEEDCGTEIELDVLAICCEYREHESAVACIAEQGYRDCEFEEEDTEEEKEEKALGFLHDHTQVVEFDGGIVIAAF